MQHSSLHPHIEKPAGFQRYQPQPRQGHALLVRSGIKGSAEMMVPHEGSVCLQRESKVGLQTEMYGFSIEIASYHPI